MAKRLESKFLIIEGKGSEFLSIGLGAGGPVVDNGVITEGPFKGFSHIIVQGGGFLCCDNCNKDISEDETCYYVSVLNRIFCKECFENWHKRATYYAEDRPYETRNFNCYSRLLSEKGLM